MSKRSSGEPIDGSSRPLRQPPGRQPAESLLRFDQENDPTLGTSLYEAVVRQDTTRLTTQGWLDRLDAIALLKSRLAALQAGTIAGFDDSLRGVSADLGHRYPQPGDREAKPGERRWIAGDLRSVSDEVAGILELRRGHATTQIHRSCELVHNFPATLAALSAGHLTERAAFTIVSELSVLEDLADLRAAEAAILAWIKTHPLVDIKQACRREVARRSPEATEKAYERAHDERSVRMYTDDLGRSDIVHNQNAIDGAAVMTSLSRAAIRYRRLGDPRTMDQLRADIALSRLLPNTKRPTPHPQTTTADTASTAGTVGAAGAASTASAAGTTSTASTAGAASTATTTAAPAAAAPPTNTTTSTADPPTGEPHHDPADEPPAEDLQSTDSEYDDAVDHRTRGESTVHHSADAHGHTNVGLRTAHTDGQTDAPANAQAHASSNDGADRTGRSRSVDRDGPDDGADDGSADRVRRTDADWVDESLVGAEAAIVIHATAAEVRALINGDPGTGGETDRQGPLPQSALRKYLLKALKQTLLPPLPRTPPIPSTSTSAGPSTSTGAVTSASAFTCPSTSTTPGASTGAGAFSLRGPSTEPEAAGSPGAKHPSTGVGSARFSDGAVGAGRDTRVRLQLTDRPPVGDPDRYTPSAALDRYVRLRDRTCQFPGCNRPAEFTDLDHRISFAAGGRTTAANLWCLCRHHHRLKHEGGWQIHLTPAGTYTWISPTGRHYPNKHNTRAPDAWSGG
ncbi:DUF222 domain-containing protein [Kribbella sp. NPDC051718]|uniref:HNH endonuclease signature motif containing protein n=1 Tax=Kribbella sp. NPDC051718 TaxID=3155168 RepID=UPI003420A9AA